MLRDQDAESSLKADPAVLLTTLCTLRGKNTSLTTITGYKNTLQIRFISF